MKLFSIPLEKKNMLLIAAIVVFFFITLSLQFYSQTIVLLLNNWGVLYREKPVTELYFTDFNSLPSIINPQEDQSFGFGIKNLEQKTTKYTFHILTIQGTKETVMRSGTLIIKNGESKELRVPLTIPDTKKETKIEVRLVGKSPIIHFWMRPAVAIPSPSKRPSRI